MRRTLSVVLCLAAALLAARASGAATITVNSGGDLQAAIRAAVPGDTIVLQAGATFTGNYELPAKGGTSYITIRSSTPDASLPPAGTRMTPNYAPLLARIRSDANGPAMRTTAGASYWRLLFLEFAPSVSNGAANLVELGAAGTSQNTMAAVPHHLVMDRCYLHGDPTYGQRRGVALNSGDTDLINSYFADFKSANEAQAIGSWNGPGPFLIENNYLEGAGENIMFGGADPSIPNLVATGITIRRNYITKPTSWIMQSWTVKNLVEFKNAQNVVVEGNVIENSWVAAQQGYAVLFTPRNQEGTAPWTIVRNVVFRNNIMRHVAGGFSISGYDDGRPSQQTSDITISNNLFYDVSTAWSIPNGAAAARFAIIGGGPRNVTIDHNTIDNNGSATILIYGGYTPTSTVQIYGFQLTNNLLRDNAYGVFGDAVGEGSAGLRFYTPNAIVARNAFGGAAATQYPTGNDFPTMAQWQADFVNIGAANYRLVATSLSKNASTDAKDIGVDFTALDAALNATPAPTPAPTFTVQFENYDTGGEGVGYHDTTPGNKGGLYRSDNVDIAAANDTGGGYYLGWVKAGEWVNYTISAATAGTFTIDLRVASNGAGGTFHIEVNGVDKTGPLTIPNTGGWQAWTTISKRGVALGAGKQVIRVVMDTNGATGGVGNFNWFAIR